MITEVTGVTTIDSLYLQLLYACQFRCAHCFHGERLAWHEAYTLDEAVGLVEIMRRDYRTETVCLLGGEPFLYRDLGALLQHIKDAGMRTEICTNGYRIGHKLAELGHGIDLLRISLEGLEQTNDAIRHPGSFHQAMDAFDQAREQGVPAAATMTVTATNLRDVVPLARMLQHCGVRELKLHHLRPVGYARAHPELLIHDRDDYRRLREQIDSAHLSISLVLDQELSPLTPQPQAPYQGAAPRIEADPRGCLTFSCRAVGVDEHALIYNKATRTVREAANTRNELALAIAPVVYTRG